MKYSKASHAQVFLATSIIYLFSAGSAADILVSCDAVSCPLDSYNKATCTVGNTTSSAIGVASFEVPSSISSSPFTWTIGLQSVNTRVTSGNSSAPSNVSNIDRTYFLGTPADTDLTKAGTNGTCALFFEGIAEYSKFPKNGVGMNDNTSTGTCADALTADCVTALIQQAESEAAKIDGTGDKCAALQTALANSPPEACIGAASRKTWGLVAARDLSKLDVTKGSEDNCHPTTGENYQLSLAASFRRQTPTEYQKYMTIATGVTPVMTVFWEGSKADVQLTCLKPVAGMAGAKTDTESQTQDGAGVKGNRMSAVVAIMAVSAFFMTL